MNRLTITFAEFGMDTGPGTTTISHIVTGVVGIAWAVAQ